MPRVSPPRAEGSRPPGSAARDHGRGQRLDDVLEPLGVQHWISSARPAEAVNAERSFGEHDVARRLHERVIAVVERLGDTEVRAGRSQIAFRRRRPFAAVWTPARYLRGAVAPLVLTVDLPARDASPRWKEVVQPASGRFTHHLELRDPDDVDGEVARWLRQAWEAAG